jgi:hypothetical protein
MSSQGLLQLCKFFGCAPRVVAAQLFLHCFFWQPDATGSSLLYGLGICWRRQFASDQETWACQRGNE